MEFNTIIGQAARKEDFFPRPQIQSEIWKKLKPGSNLLFVGPRRVGKSSILFNLLDEPKEKHIIIYYTSESVNNENEFYRKLFNHIVERLNTFKKYRKKLTTLGKTFLKSIESIGKDGIKFQHNNSISYYDEVMALVRNLDLGEDRMIVLIDEFAQTIENIMRDENDDNAIHFLETNREIRQRPEIHKKLQFIYTGSIGLENIVERINGINFINDLHPISIPPLSRKEAEGLTDKIIRGSEVTFADGAFEHLLNLIEWWIPFYFQIILDEVPKILVANNSTVITKDDIDTAVKNALKQRIYFEHWFTRLRNAFKGDEFSFVKEVLNIISEKNKFSSSGIVDLAIKHKLEDSYNNLINTLKYDGYINNEDNPKTYRFNSPLLREWWNRNVAN
ncbi:MAG: AAA family ATPase [Bacteroidetes bacterium]|nr:AAA family ATPase [Bacteroidota bacterium]